MAKDFPGMIARLQMMQPPGQETTGMIPVGSPQPTPLEMLLAALGQGVSKYTPEIGMGMGAPFGGAGMGFGLAAGTGLQRLIAPEEARARDLAFEQMPPKQKAFDIASGGIMPMGIIKPVTKPVPGGAPALPELWPQGATPKTVEYQNIERMPGLAKEKKNLFTGVSQPNPKIDEVAAAFEGGQVTNLNELQTLFENNVNRDRATGKSLFNDVFERQIRLRRKLMSQPEYNEVKQSVSTARSNTKTEGEITPLDCSRGCVGFCPECYAAFGKNNPRSAAFPVGVDWVGNVSKAKEGSIFRVGEMGEPGFDPEIWKKTGEPEFRKMMASDKNFTPEELYQIAEPAYDWSYFNKEMQKTGLAGQDKKVYIISKLNSLTNFDPSVIKNMQVSLDTLNPEAFFRTLKNVDALKAMDPNYNMQLRIRSIATSNDEINTLQKIAVDYANKNNIPVMETRLRFKGREGAEQAEVLPEYIWGGGQYVHQSYYPSIFPKTPQQPDKIGTTRVSSFQAHTTEGPKDTGVYLTTDQKGKDALWKVWQPDGTMVGEYPQEKAKEVGQGLANFYSEGKAPTKQTVWEINRNESPLSQFGLSPNLHYQCNSYNVSGPACKECGGCKAFTQLEQMRAK